MGFPRPRRQEIAGPAPYVTLLLMVFGFPPKLPVSPQARAWVDRSLDRLEECLGAEVLRGRPVILPTPEFFPDGGDGTEEAARTLFGRVCGYMRVDPGRIHLAFFEEEHVADDLRRSLPDWEEQREGAAGFYRDRPDAGKIVIAIKHAKLRDPMALIATMAHELGHVLLLADGHIERDAPDMEPMTDLLTVFCGLGLFTANSAMRFSQWQDASSHGWSVQRQGYLPETMFGYALAAYARRRGEDNPPWARRLNINVGAYFRQSCRCLAWEAKRSQD